jgi:putative glutamine amidotransferase
MGRPKIGIVTNISSDESPASLKTNKISVNSDYTEAIEKVQGIPLLIPVVSSDESLNAYVDICDGFLFSGGTDINPICYNKNPHRKLGVVNSRLDKFQLELMKKVLESEKPFLAICRGIQILNVACGGSLYQDLDEIPRETIQHQQNGERYDVIHKVNFQEDSILYDLLGREIYVNSFHHQSINKLANSLIAVGHAPDEVVEAVQVKDYRWGVGVQWHPEMMFSHFDSMRPLFEALVKASS